MFIVERIDCIVIERCCNEVFRHFSLSYSYPKMQISLYAELSTGSIILGSVTRIL